MKKLFIFLMVFSLIFMSVAPSVFGAYANVGPTTEFQGDVGTTGDFLINGTKIAFGDVTNALGVTMANVGSTAINASLIADSDDDTDLGSATYSWRNIYVGTAGKIFLGTSEECAIEVTDANTISMTASSNVDFTGGLDVSGGIIVGSAIVSDAADTDNLGATDAEWKEVYISDAGHLYLGDTQETNLQHTGSNVLTLTASGGVVTSAGLTVAGDIILAGNSIGRDADNDIDFETDNQITFRTNAADEITIDSAGTLGMGANDITLTGSIGRDVDNELNWGTDNSLAIVINGNTHNIVGIDTGAGDNDTLVTQGYVDDTIGAVSNFVEHFMDVNAADSDYAHGAAAGDSSAQDVTGCTNPDIPRNVSITTTNNSTPSGDVQVWGVSADGVTDSEEITVSAGSIAYGDIAWATLTKYVIPATVDSLDYVSLGISDKIGLTNTVSAEADVYKITLDGTDSSIIASGNVDTTYNTIDCSVILENSDYTVLYHN